MEKEQAPSKDNDRSEHHPIDPGRSAARESRVPGKKSEPKRSEPDSSQHRKDAGHD